MGDGNLVGELPAAISFNGQYLRELIGALSNEDRTVTFEVNGGGRPGTGGRAAG